MNRTLHPGGSRNGTAVAAAVLCALVFCALGLPAQTSAAPVPTPAEGQAAKSTVPTSSRAPSEAMPTAVTPPPLPAMPTPPGAELDRVVAIVNGDLILDSDVDQERRLGALLPYGEAEGTPTRGRALDRLINRDLILQQAHLQPQDEISTADARNDLAALRQSLPNCRELQCESQTGWDHALAGQGFTDATLTELWRQRMEVLAFIEQRFRIGIKITPEQIAAYYKQTLLPQYAALHAAPAPLAAVTGRIQQVLLEQQVSKLLDDWLQSLRAQGSVVVLHPGEVAP
jgi:peptidyl-prolyl cis-trans isomerase SurA